jgi:phosphoribosylformylglycinamidine (FGAM) synthase-like enzyme
MVQTNTVHGPGAESGLMRIKGTDRALAMALDGNGRWCYLNPELGAQHAVAEAARKVACTGATPVAATNCLNFGNPEKPEIMAQLSSAIDGIAAACRALGTPITGGNVSLYNETRGVGIYPTPVLGIVGILENIHDAVGSAFGEPGLALLLVSRAHTASLEDRLESFGSSEYAKTVLGELWGAPPALDLATEATLHKLLAALAAKKLLRSARDISDGGIAVALAEGCFEGNVGVRVQLQGIGEGGEMPVAWQLFGESATQVLLTCEPEKIAAIREAVKLAEGLVLEEIGETVSEVFRIAVNGAIVVDETVAGLQHRWEHALEVLLHEVMA